MKRIWWKVSILIIALVLQNFLFIIVASPVTDLQEYDQEKPYQQYRNDWQLQTNYRNNNSVRKTYFFNDEEGRDNTHSTLAAGSVDDPMDSAWPMQGHDVVHTCRSPYGTENNHGAEIWRVRGDRDGAVWGSAVIDNDGIIYFGTTGSDFSLYAMYQNGTRKWRFTANGPIWVTPALADNGDIYCTTWGGLSYLQAITKNGTERWRFDQESSSASAPTIGSDGTIYFGTSDYNIFAVNPNGTEKWRYTTGYIVMGSPAIGQDGTIYIGSGDHYLYALYPDGTLRWRFETGDEIKGSASITPDSTICVPSFDGYLYALYPNGTMKWRASTGGSIAAAGTAFAEDGTIYVGTEQLRAFYPNGTLKWTTNVQGSIYGTVPAVSADGTIYVSAGNSLVAVNPDGSEKWRKQLTTAQIRSSPSIGPDDRVYVGSEDPGLLPYGYLHAFGLGPLRAEAGGPYSGLASHTPVQFNGLVFGGRPPYTYLWEFGDGNTSNEQNPSHLYRDIGIYNITFTITDNEGNTSTDTTTATITYGPPLISFIKPESAIYLANLKLFPFQYPLVFGRITIEADVTHPFLSIDRVEFYKWDHLQMTDTTPPYTWTWSERIPLRGTHKIGITIKAYTSETTGYGFMEIIKFF